MCPNLNLTNWFVSAFPPCPPPPPRQAWAQEIFCPRHWTRSNNESSQWHSVKSVMLRYWKFRQYFGERFAKISFLKIEFFTNFAALFKILEKIVISKFWQKWKYWRAKYLFFTNQNLISLLIFWGEGKSGRRRNITESCGKILSKFWEFLISIDVQHYKY